MTRPGIRLIAILVLLSASLSAESLPELFQKAKAQVKSQSWREALATLDQLDAESAKPGNEAARQQLVAPLAFYRGVCEANLDQLDKAEADFSTFRQAQPGASIDQAVYSRKAVAAFNAARKDSAFEAASNDASQSHESHSLLQRFEEFQAPPNAADKPDERWADGPVKWIMTPEETAAWTALKSGADRADFVEKFWQARNPKPGDEDNRARREFERRTAFADAYFQADAKSRGSLSDAGMVFVLLGPPTRANRRPVTASEDRSIAEGNSQEGKWWYSNRNSVHIDGVTLLDASSSVREVWHYGREALPKGVSIYELNVVFVTKKGYGRFVLQRDPAVLAALETAKSKGHS
jgi:GWxTD domain-containing protein